MHIVVSGATGTVGRRLVPLLLADGHAVTVASRDAAKAARAFPGCASCTPDNLPAACDAIVNLSGAVVAQRWTAAHRRAIRDSRVIVTGKLREAAESRGATFISASAVGFYGDRGDELLDESSAPGSGFLPEICREWEDAARSDKVRSVSLRVGIVLDRHGGVLKKLIPVFKLFAGGQISHGRMYMPWVHHADITGLIRAALTDARYKGAINACAPQPATNREFSIALAKATHRPLMPRVPAFMLKLIYGAMATVVLSSQRAVPKRALELGYQFQFTDIGQAVLDAVQDRGGRGGG